MFNVLGDPIDEKPFTKKAPRDFIHRSAPTYAQQSTEAQILETGIKVIDLLMPYARVEKLVFLAELAWVKPCWFKS